MKLLSPTLNISLVRFFPIFAFLECVMLYIIFVSQNLFLGLIALLGVFALPIIVGSPGYSLLLLVFYISVLPSEAWGQRYEFFKFYVHEEVVAIWIVLIIILLFVRHLREHRWRIDWTGLDWLVLAFLVYGFFNAIWGTYHSQNVFRDLFYISLYCIYFVARFLFNTPAWINRFLVAILITSTVVAIEYILLQLQHLDIRSILISRVFTQQPHIGQVAIALLAATIIFSKRRMLRILALIILIPNFIMVILSQQRGLWLGLFFTLFTLLLLYYFQNGINIVRITKFGLSLILIVAVMAGILIIAEKALNLEFLSTVFLRLSTFEILSIDLSVNLRLIQISRVLAEWKNHLFMGSGLGATFPRFIGARITDGIDNSYFFMLWKMGILGILPFLSIT